MEWTATARLLKFEARLRRGKGNDAQRKDGQSPDAAAVHNAAGAPSLLLRTATRRRLELPHAVAVPAMP